MNKPDLTNLKRRAVVCGAGLMTAATLAAPLSAFADAAAAPGTNTGETQTTEVTIQSIADNKGQTTSNENLTFSTPTVIPFTAVADGTLTGPSADAVKIVNKSAFPVRVTNMAVAEKDPFHIVDDVTTSTGTNDVQFTVHGAKAAASVDLSHDTTWNMGYAGSGSDSISLDTSAGKIARVTADLKSAQKVATITWTLASGANAAA